MKFPLRPAMLLLAGALLFSCSKDKDIPQPPDPEPDPIPGCMDPASMNYNPLATVDDGSCEYATIYMPLNTGNYWRLTGEITIPIIGTTIPVVQEITVGKDSLIGDLTWYKVTDETSAGGFNLQAGTWWYTQAPNGKLLRIPDGDTTQNCYITYPLEFGATWYSTTAVPDFSYRMMSYNYEMTVPAGTFNDVLGIEVTDLNTDMVTTLFFAKEKGLLKNSMTFDLFGTEFNIEPELDSLRLVP